MTETEQFKACAELDGFTEIDPQFPNRLIGLLNGHIARVPDYSTRDAVIGVIEKQPQKIQHAVIKLLDTDCIDGWYDWQVLKVLLATPAQLREALLRACGKWRT